MKVIFGSGIIGLLARFILGPEWTIVPFYKSRFFSFNPALDDNFIIRDNRIDDALRDLLGGIDQKIYLYNRSWSLSGEIFRGYKSELYYPWAYKLFGTEPAAHIEHYFKQQMVCSVYDTRINQLYAHLMERYKSDLLNGVGLGQVSEVGDHYFVSNGRRHDFDQAISTIPLNKLLELMKIKHELRSRSIHYIHVESTDLNFEGANQLLVVDNNIGFYKVTNIAPNRYLFYCQENIVNPGAYLMAFMKNFDILDGTSIDNVIPVGPLPKLDTIDDFGIHCIGSSAQWDWCMDVSSCIIRLIKYSTEGDKYGKKKPIVH